MNRVFLFTRIEIFIFGRMTTLFKKLNFKNQEEIAVLHHPDSFQEEIDMMSSETRISFSVKQDDSLSFLLAFVQTEKGLDSVATQVKSKLSGDAILWIAYPKKTSRKYTCEFDRDSGWVQFGAMGLEPVRMVAIDEDWSALRFRKVEYIKNITRRESFAITKEAKARTTQKNK